MRLPLAVLPLLLTAVPAPTQGPPQSLIFSGRFPFVSLDAVNERLGGSITRLEEFDFSCVTPGPNAFARSLQTSTGHHALMGDANGDGNFTKFHNFKTYFENIQLGGLFVKHADKAAADAAKVFWTVRSNVAGKQIEVLTIAGTVMHVMRPGDFVRLTSNGNAEFFVTADLLDVAAGPPPAGQSSVKGASAMCQDALGNLYYSPPSGGHWVNGNQGGIAIHANDGSIVTIDAANITYDMNGNVQALVPNSARLLWEEVGVGTSPGGTSVRGMVLNSGAYDRTGSPVQVTGVFGKACGLDFDPNGGTMTPAYADPAGNYPPVPNLVFASDAGSYAGTIWSTANGGSVAMVNGVLCGSTTPGLAADGRWLGVRLDLANFQPSLMGLCLVHALPAPTVLDIPSFGALPLASQQATLEVDLHSTPFSVAFLLATIGPNAPGASVPSLPTASLPFASLFGPGSSPFAFTYLNPTTLSVLFTNQDGYASYIRPNWNNGTFAGYTLMLQAVVVGGPSFQLSNPALMQVKS